MKWAPSASDLFGLNQGFYLDFPGSALSPGCIYEQDFEKYTATGRRPCTPHRPRPERPTGSPAVLVLLVLQRLEQQARERLGGDQAPVSGSLDRGSAASRADRRWIRAARGRRARRWTTTSSTREGDHPVVYPSAGSHASYFGSAVYIGRGAARASAATPPPAHPIGWSPDSLCCPTRRRPATTRWPGWRSRAVGASDTAGRTTARPGRRRRIAGSIPRRGSRTSATTVS